MSKPNSLLRDPIFQLNMVLWSLKLLPGDNILQVRPILQEAGYYLLGINRRVILPQLDNLKSFLPSIDPPVPDIWLRHKSDNTNVIIELKSQGFGLDSSNINQIKKILIASYNLAESVGSKDEVPGYVIVMAPFLDSKMVDTLDTLREEISNHSISSAPVSVIGLYHEKDNYLWKSPSLSSLPGPLQEVLSGPVTVISSMGFGKEGEDEKDIIPLYLIPWIPNVDANASPLISDGLASLTGRILTYVQEKIGNSKPPINLALKPDLLLHEATYEVFDYWKGQDRNIFFKKVVNIIDRSINSAVVSYKSDKLIEIDIRTEEIQDEIMKELEKANIYESASNLEGVDTHIQPNLFK